MFRANGWKTACKRAGLVPVPRPYDLRHSFASLLLAEGQAVHYVAAQLGHSPVLTLSTYGHLIAEYADATRINAEAEIVEARSRGVTPKVGVEVDEDGCLTMHRQSSSPLRPGR